MMKQLMQKTNSCKESEGYSGTIGIDGTRNARSYPVAASAEGGLTLKFEI